MADARLKIEYRSVESLIPYARNPRVNDPVVDLMASGIKEFGFRYPILIKSDGSIVDGHLRVKAALKLKLKEIPTVCADDMTPAQIKAFRIYVNRVPELVEWDREMLGLELEELKGLDFDLEMTGFGQDDIEDIMNPIPAQNKAIDEEGMTDTKNVCPSCGFKW